MTLNIVDILDLYHCFKRLSKEDIKVKIGIRINNKKQNRPIGLYYIKFETNHGKQFFIANSFFDDSTREIDFLKFSLNTNNLVHIPYTTNMQDQIKKFMDD